jgi:hypothetical protein
VKKFDETYADQDFERELAKARAGWMTQVPRASQPDLKVEGLSNSLVAIVLGTLTGRGR